MKVFILASLLSMLFADIHSAPAAEVPASLHEEQPTPDNTAVVNNVVEPVLLKAEVADTEVQNAPVELGEEVPEDDQALADPLTFCPPGWLSLGSNCYKPMSSSRTWISAEQYCVTQGGHLASAGSFEEYNNIHSLAQFLGNTYYWIGGYYFQGYWKWVDGSRFDYSNWSNHNSPSSYPCMLLQRSGGWTNTNCGNSNPFICVRKSC